MKKNKFIIPLLTMLFTFGFLFRSDGDIYFEISKSIDIFGEVYKQATLNYVDDINPQKFMENGIEGMLKSLDPYSNFYNYEKERDIEVITKGKYGGIGASVGLRDDEVTIMSLMEGYPAQLQGLRIGDVLVQIDSIKIGENNYDNLGSKLKGEPGSFVNLKILRKGIEDTLIFNLVREEVVINNIMYADFYPEESNNLYIKLTGFSRTAGSELLTTINKKSEEKEVESIILDLRGNPGGLLDAAIDVSEKFLKEKQLIVSVSNRDSIKIEKYYSKESPIAGEIPLAVLINEGSASASEIVAGAIQDHDRGIILGERSFGKGLVQSVITLPYNNTMKLTTGKYYTPSGRLIQKIDYNNRVLDIPQEIKAKQFKTENGRIVFSAGGINPDSTLKPFEVSKISTEFLSKGVFFKFASDYFNKNEIDGKLNVEQIEDKKLFEDFLNYLKNFNYDFLDNEQKYFEKLKKNVFVSESEEIKHKLIELENLFIKSHNQKLLEKQNEILDLIKLEFAARNDGMSGRIRLAQRFDTQLHQAVQILQNQNLYQQILNK